MSRPLGFEGFDIPIESLPQGRHGSANNHLSWEYRRARMQSLDLHGFVPAEREAAGCSPGIHGSPGRRNSSADDRLHPIVHPGNDRQSLLESCSGIGCFSQTANPRSNLQQGWSQSWLQAGCLHLVHRKGIIGTEAGSDSPPGQAKGYEIPGG